jgi:hypothetical protein
MSPKMRRLPRINGGLFFRHFDAGGPCARISVSDFADAPCVEKRREIQNGCAPRTGGPGSYAKSSSFLKEKVHS